MQCYKQVIVAQITPIYKVNSYFQNGLIMCDDNTMKRVANCCGRMEMLVFTNIEWNYEIDNGKFSHVKP
jgi:hypothetical protein